MKCSEATVIIVHNKNNSVSNISKEFKPVSELVALNFETFITLRLRTEQASF